MIGNVKTGYWALEEFRKPKFLDVDFSSKKFHIEKHSLKLGFIEVTNAIIRDASYMCNVNGNIHMYANKGLHNADSFRMSDLCRVFTELRELYSIEPNATPLYSVEFGVNIKLPYDPRRVLKAVRMYRGHALAPIAKLGLEYRNKEYQFRIYDKGRQCGLPGFDNVLRIEMRCRSSYLKKRGLCIPLLGSLLNSDAWQVFEFLLLEMIDNTMIVETAPVEALTKKEQKLFALFTGNDWKQIDKFKRYREKKIAERIEESKTPMDWQSLNRNVLHKKKSGFTELAKRTGVDSIKEELKRCISVECQALRDI
jgi:hypothetical protein